jgi:hypothetical protein
MGRKGSKAVKLAIQAPLTPSPSSTSGPTQHTDALMAARTPAVIESFEVGVSIGSQ